MSQAKTQKAKPARKPISLFETVYGKPTAIDREKGVIRHVKIIGHESKNGRRYPQPTLEAAKALYEGRMVNKNHLRAKGQDRDVDDRFGWFEGVLAEPDGLFGDFHVLDPTDPLARKLFTAAEQKPDAFGFSHHALGDGRQDGSTFVVESIQSVESVDIVAEPASTKGLFESTEQKMITVKALFESVQKAKPWQPSTAKGRRLKALLEMMDEPKPEDPVAAMAGEEMVEPAADVSPDDQVGEAFKQMVCSVFDDTSLDAKGKIKKIGEILKAQEKLMSSEAPAAPAAEGKGKGEGEEPKPNEAAASGKGDEPPEEKPVPESFRRELDALKADKAICVLLEDAGLKFGKPDAREAFIESLIPLSDQRRKVLIEERKTLTESVQLSGRPRSQSPGSVTRPSGNGSGYEQFVESIRN